MRSDRRNMPEQELSIKEREQELFVEPDDPSAPPTSVKPFAFYLRETPANPLSTEVKAILWAIGLVVLLLFAVAIWRAQRSPRSRPKPQASEAAATAHVTPPIRSPTEAVLRLWVFPHRPDPRELRCLLPFATGFLLVVLQQELRVDRLEAEPAADVLVVLLRPAAAARRPPAGPSGSARSSPRRRPPARPPCGPAPACRAAGPPPVPARPARPASRRGRGAGRRPRSGR